MYGPGQYGQFPQQPQQMQWQPQQQQQQPPNHAALPQLAASGSMSPEAAAQYRDYGYGSAPQRAGNAGQGHHQGPRQHHGPRHGHNATHRHGTTTQAQPMSLAKNPTNNSAGVMQQQQQHQPPQAMMQYQTGLPTYGPQAPVVSATPMAGNVSYQIPQHGHPGPSAGGPPAKRPRYDSSAAAQGVAPPLPPGPAPPPQHQHPINPPLPPGPPPTGMPGAGYQYHDPSQASYYGQTQQHQQQQLQPMHFPSSPLPPQHQVYPTQQATYGPQQPHHQQQTYYAQPQQQPQQQQQQHGSQASPLHQQTQHSIAIPTAPRNHHHHHQQQQASNHSLPLAVAPMKAASNNNNNGSSSIRIAGPALSNTPAPPPPKSTAPPPPPPPPPAAPAAPSAGTSKPASTGTTKLPAKGAASLPPIPTGIASLPLNPLTGAAVAAPTVQKPKTDAPSTTTSAPPIPTGPKGRPPVQQDASPTPSIPPTGPSALGTKPPTAPSSMRNASSHRGGRGGGHPGRGGFEGGRRSVSTRSSLSDRQDNRSSAGTPGPHHDGGRSSGKRPFQPSKDSQNVSRKEHIKQRAEASHPSSGNSPARGGGTIGRTLNAHQVSQDKAFKGARSVSKQTTPTPSTGNPSSPARNATTSTALAAALGKKDSLKRTLTDFRIESLEIVELGWLWKASPGASIVPDEKESVTPAVTVEHSGEGKAGEDKAQVKVEATEAEASDGSPQVQASSATSSQSAKLEEGPDDTSAAMQRRDSRKEKRKHSSDDEDEDVIANGEDDHATSRGKKAKNEEQETGGPDSIQLDVAVESTSTVSKDLGVGPAVGDKESKDDSMAIDGAELLTSSHDSPPETTEQDAGPKPEDELAAMKDLEVASTSSEAEVAASVVAKLAVGAPDVEREEKETKADGPMPDADDRQSGAVRTNPETSDATGGVKKQRENSRLRIYFSSPIELEQKDKRKEKLVSTPQPEKRKKQKKNNASVPDQVQASAEESVDHTSTDAAAKEEEDSQIKEEETDAVDEDLDGEPLKAEEPDTDNVQKDHAGNADAQEGSIQKDDNKSDERPEESPEDDKEEVKDAKPSKGAPGSDDAAETAVAQPAPDRVSISYARNTRRLVINADVVQELTVHRAEAKVEIKVRLLSAEDDVKTGRMRAYRGIFLEVSEGDNQFSAVDQRALEQAWPADSAIAPAHPDQQQDVSSVEEDQLIPPLHRLPSTLAPPRPSESNEGSPDTTATASESTPAAVPSVSAGVTGPPEVDDGSTSQAGYMTVVARLDRTNPLTEAKWVRSGNADDWIVSLGTPASNGAIPQPPHPKKAAGDYSSTANPIITGPTTVSAWKGKIKVVDPDAPPTFQHALENWLSTSNARNGFDGARYRFVTNHFQDVKNVLEVLLRLIRGVSLTNPASAVHGASHDNHHHHQHHQSAVVASQAAAAEAPYPDQQTPISLATFQLFKLGLEAAVQAGVPKDEIDRKVGEIVRTLPYFLIFRSLDSMFSDYKRQQQQQNQTQTQQRRSAGHGNAKAGTTTTGSANGASEKQSK